MGNFTNVWYVHSSSCIMVTINQHIKPSAALALLSNSHKYRYAHCCAMQAAVSCPWFPDSSSLRLCSTNFYFLLHHMPYVRFHANIRVHRITWLVPIIEKILEFMDYCTLPWQNTNALWQRLQPPPRTTYHVLFKYSSFVMTSQLLLTFYVPDTQVPPTTTTSPHMFKFTEWIKIKF